MLLFLVPRLLTGSPSDARYIGPEPCALCHKEIAAKQSQTAMATTWQGPFTSWLPAGFDAAVSDDLTYELKRGGASFSYSVNNFDGAKTSLPVGILLGGRRHGLGFLAAISEVNGTPLERPALIQARYAWSPEKNKLLLAPGCSSAKPQSLETALGLVLSPTFEARCLACHGQPNSLGTGKDGGVHCESCHGPGSEHLKAVGRGSPGEGISNPKHLSAEESMAVCAQCHVGLTRFSDPSADDLLVANQVRAIKSSECFIQSSKAFSCTACHDPHDDTTADDRAIRACLGCHSSSSKREHAGICPINAVGKCIGCHMPSVEMGPLHLVDHLIRVHPEQKITAAQHDDTLKTQVPPISGYLRTIVASTAEAAEEARRRVQNGESFYKVAQDISVDSTSSIGGYLGRKVFNSDNSLGYGEISGVEAKDGQWVIVQRLPRDFRWEAEQLQREAEDLAHGNPAAAITKSQEALKIYPQFLEALRFIGLTYAQNGNPTKGADVLGVAARLYPEDAPTRFALASVFELLGNKARASEAYRATISLEKDFTAAYLNLGMIQADSGQLAAATETFRQGLMIDPLSAEINSALGQVLIQTGDTARGRQLIELARRLQSVNRHGDERNHPQR